MSEANITVRATDLTGDVLGKVKSQMADLGGSSKHVGEQLKAGIEDPMSAIKGQAVSMIEGIGPAGVATVAFAGVAAAAGYAVFELGMHAIEAGERFNDFSEKTTISVEAASQLDYVAKVTGTSLESMGNAIFMMQKRMADDGSGQFAAGLAKIHLTIEEIEKLTPEQQFFKISESFKENTTQTDRASVAMALFGRQGRDLIPTMMKDLSGLNEEAKALGHTMSTEDSEAFEKYGMAWRGLKEAVAWTTTETGVGVIHFFEALAEKINQGLFLIDPFAEDVDKLGKRLAGELPKAKDIIDQIAMSTGKMTMSTEDAKAAEKDLDDQVKESIKNKTEYQKKVDGIVSSLMGESSKTKETVEAIKQVIGSHTTNVEAIDRTVAAIDKLRKQHLIPMNDDLMTWAAGNRTVAGALDTVQMGLSQMIERAPDLSEHVAEMANKFQEASDELPPLTSYLLETSTALTSVSDVSTDFTIPAFMGLMDVVEQTKYHVDELRDSGKSLADSLGSSFGDFSSTLIKTLEHGGDTLRATEAFGVQIASALAKGMATKMSAGGSGPNDDGSTNGGDGGFGFGQPTSKGGKEAFAAAQLGAGLIAQMTSGAEMSRTQAAMHDAAVGAQYGAIAGPLGMAVGAGVGALVGALKVSAQELAGRQIEAAFEESFGGFQGMMTAVGGAYAATGRAAGQAAIDVKKLLDAENQGSAAAKAMIEQINQAFVEQKQDATDLDAAVKHYGFTIEQLGPAMQKQQLDAQAKQVINDWRLLVGSGIDVVEVDKKMAATTWDYLQIAKKTGQEVPEAMKPVIQSLLDQGVFTDANGDKITDMATLGITFSETMTAGFDKVVAKLQQLLEKIGGTASALANLPASKTIEIVYNQRTTGDGPDGRESFANEGYDLVHPTRAIVGDAAGDSESVLHASTVKDIVRASRNAGSAGGDSQLRQEMSGLRADIRTQLQAFQTALLRMPRILADAQQLSGTI